MKYMHREMWYGWICHDHKPSLANVWMGRKDIKIVYPLINCWYNFLAHIYQDEMKLNRLWNFYSFNRSIRRSNTSDYYFSSYWLGYPLSQVIHWNLQRATSRYTTTYMLLWNIFSVTNENKCYYLQLFATWK